MPPFGKLLEMSVKDLTREAVEGALSVAGATREYVGGAWFSNTTQGVLEGQHCVPGEIALRDMGFEAIPLVNVENDCASASPAFNGACTAIKAGGTAVARAGGADKMSDADESRTVPLLDGPLDGDTPP